MYSLIILIKALPQGLWISAFPNSFFDPPPGPTYFFFSGFPPALFVRGLNALLIACAVFMLFGCWTKAASFLFAGGFTFLQSWEYSFGKINHEFIAILAPALLAWAGWGNACSVDSVKQARKTTDVNPGPIALFAFVLSIMMLSAGIPKIATGWLNLRTHAVLSYVLESYFISGAANWFNGTALRVRSALFWEPFDWISCALEVAFVCVFFRRSLLRIVCALATFFHLGILLLMEIYSWGNVLAYGVFADWDGMVRFFPYNLVPRLGSVISKCSPQVVIIVAGTLALFESIIGNPIARLFGSDPEQYQLEVGSCLVVLAALTGAVFLLRKLFRRKERI